jgi:tetratricopeptide (TPR) repeat protein
MYYFFWETGWQMAINLADLLGSFKKLLLEKGPLTERAEWCLLQQQVSDLPTFESCGKQLPAKFLLLLCLLRNKEGTEERHDCLKKIFSAALNLQPAPDFIEVIKLIPTEDLEKSLLPFLYESGNPGAMSCYLAAKAKIYLTPRAFGYFLQARPWSKTELFNLAFLARQSQIAQITSDLEKLAVSPDISARQKEAIDEFRYIVFEQRGIEPLLPDSLKSATEENQAQAPSEIIVTKTAATKAAKKTVKRTVAFTSANAGLESAAKPVKQGKLKSNGRATRSEEQEKEFNWQNFILVAAILFFSLAAILITRYSYFDAQEYHEKQTAARKQVPSFWIDAVSQKKITEQFLTADRDYRMGELFLTRDRFKEAVKLFEDALAVEPDHINALFRLGYCKMKLGNYEGAADAFYRTLRQNSKFKYANLNLARIAVIQKNFNSAKDFYGNELSFNKDPGIALEFAGFLNEQGKTAQAQAVIDEFQKLYPDKMFILPKKEAVSKVDNRVTE